MTEARKLLIIAGEVSGDMHAAKLLKAIRVREPGVIAFGVGGEHLRAEGMEIIHDAREMAVVGVAEVFKRFFFFRRVFFNLLAVMRERKPDALILVDYPGFNLRFAARAKAMGFKVIYYICPQVWAWNRSRIPKMARIIDRLISIFPFEPDVFKGTGLKVDFVGHPLVETAADAMSQAPADLPWQGEPRIALLPGSRPDELSRLLPVFLDASEKIAAKHSKASFIIAAPNDSIELLAHELLAQSGINIGQCSVLSGKTRQVLRQADVAMVASGTATLEAALMRCPMIIAYKVAALTYLLVKSLVKVKHIGMVNIVADKELCSEFVQHDATAENIAPAVLDLLVQSEKSRVVAGLEEVTRRLGDRGAHERAAAVVLEELSA